MQTLSRYKICNTAVDLVYIVRNAPIPDNVSELFLMMKLMMCIFSVLYCIHIPSFISLVCILFFKLLRDPDFPDERLSILSPPVSSGRVLKPYLNLCSSGCMRSDVCFCLRIKLLKQSSYILRIQLIAIDGNKPAMSGSG